ncbi:hypothetical protein CKJ90_05405 [Klebsiella pneumoniae]|nr:hypothetical protein CKJ90_05405 [Klebsiella pneumoniae]
MFAVVPCQWRRIIGSNSEVTREMKKFSFARFSITTRVLRAICAPFVRFPEQTGIPVASRYRPLLCGYPFHPRSFS